MSVLKERMGRLLSVTRSENRRKTRLVRIDRAINATRDSMGNKERLEDGYDEEEDKGDPDKRKRRA